MRLSFTIPCYRSSQRVAAVIDEIRAVMAQRPDVAYEIICVNDGSPDDTWKVLKEQAKAYPFVKILNLAKNKGKHTALLAAFHYVTGDIAIAVDDDMQSPVPELWRLIEPLEQGYDVSIAKYPIKKQSWLKRLGSSLNDLMVQKLMGKPKGLVFSNFIARKRFVTDAMIQYENPFPYLEGLTLQVTNRLAEVKMAPRARMSGQSGYTFKRSLQLLLNGFTAFSVKPLRLTTYLGAVFAVVGLILGIVTIAHKIIAPAVLAGFSSVMTVMCLGIGLILLLLGVIGEYVGRIYISLNKFPQYVIREQQNLDQTSAHGALAQDQAGGRS